MEAESRLAATHAIMGLLRRISTETDGFTARFADQHDLHRTDLNALSALMDADGHALTAGELSARLHLSAPATTALIDRMTRAGHVGRERNPADRRIVQVQMTDTARSVGSELFRPLGVRVGEVLDTYGVEDLERFAGMLDDIVSAIVVAQKDADERGLTED